LNPSVHVARDLGVHKEALRLWVRRAEANARAHRPVGCGGERDLAPIAAVDAGSGAER
jgi:transposase-like protein